MAVRRESKVGGALGNILGVVIFMIVAGAVLLKINLTTLIFGSPAPPPDHVVVNRTVPAEVQVDHSVPQPPADGYEHYTDKNGNEVVVVPARYEAKNTSANVQTAPVHERQHPPVSPLDPPPAMQTRNTPIQAAPPANLASIVMNAAAKAHTGMNVFESCRCSNGLLATKGDSKQEVLEKCAQPVSRFGGRGDCREIWLYNFGPNEFMQGVCFEGNRVSKVLSLEHGY